MSNGNRWTSRWNATGTATPQTSVDGEILRKKVDVGVDTDGDQGQQLNYLRRTGYTFC